jgi:hypothetical protein
MRARGASPAGTLSSSLKGSPLLKVALVAGIATPFAVITAATAVFFLVIVPVIIAAVIFPPVIPAQTPSGCARRTSSPVVIIDTVILSAISGALAAVAASIARAAIAYALVIIIIPGHGLPPIHLNFYAGRRSLGLSGRGNTRAPQSFSGR